MKAHLNLALVIRQFSFVVSIHAEDTTPAYLAVLELTLKVIVLIVTLNLDPLLIWLGA